MAIFTATEEISKLQSIDFAQTNAIEILVDKEIASSLLSRNFEGNRNVSLSRVQSYQRVMADGQWQIGDPLKFSRSGKLLDGQHRLQAVPDNCVVPFVILTGQPEQAAETYDQGMRRNALHIARVRGLKSITNHHIAILRMMFFFRFGSRTLSSALTPQKIVTLFERHEDIRESVDFSLRYRSKQFAHAFAPILAVVARAYLSDYPLSNQDLDFFLYIFQGGSESDYEKPPSARSGSAPLMLRNTYQQAIKRHDSGNTFRTSFFLRTQSALVNYSQNKNGSHLKETVRNAFPVPLLDFMDASTLEINEKAEAASREI